MEWSAKSFTGPGRLREKMNGHLSRWAWETRDHLVWPPHRPSGPYPYASMFLPGTPVPLTAEKCIFYSRIQA